MKKAWCALWLVLMIAAIWAPARAAVVTIPFDFIDSRIVVHLKLNGKGPYAFVLDSGASYTVAPQTVTALGLRSTGSFSIGGTGAGRARASRVKIASVALGPITMSDQSFTVVDLDDIRKASALPAFDGLIGTELFARYVVRIDYRAHVLTLTDPAHYVYHGAGTIVPIVFADGIPRVAASLDGIAGTFTVDTGDRLAVTFMEPVIAREHLLERYSPRIEAITGWGIGGAVPGYVARAHDLHVGALDVKDPLLRLPTVAGGFFTSRRLTGSIGTGVTDRFTLTFDYERKRLIFEDPAPDGRDPYDRSGLWLNQGGDGFEVASVAPQSPAAAAGIATGDRVVAVNGIPAHEISLADVRLWLRADPGTRVTFTVDRAGARTDVPLTLQDLV
ncbi:MAG TPA: aspartyl protease family protein [Candidatus Binatia bacterium]|nr:aspartyl protease family protein [Candidatus Binatia bacterium]